MPDPIPPYVAAPEPIPVRITIFDGSVHEGQVVGWMGQRVDVRWKSEKGNHVMFVDASKVERL